MDPPLDHQRHFYWVVSYATILILHVVSDWLRGWSIDCCTVHQHKRLYCDRVKIKIMQCNVICLKIFCVIARLRTNRTRGAVINNACMYKTIATTRGRLSRDSNSLNRRHSRKWNLVLLQVGRIITYCSSTWLSRRQRRRPPFWNGPLWIGRSMKPVWRHHVWPSIVYRHEATLVITPPTRPVCSTPTSKRRRAARSVGTSWTTWYPALCTALSWLPVTWISAALTRSRTAATSSTSVLNRTVCGDP